MDIYKFFEIALKLDLSSVQFYSDAVVFRNELANNQITSNLQTHI